LFELIYAALKDLEEKERNGPPPLEAFVEENVEEN